MGDPSSKPATPLAFIDHRGKKSKRTVEGEEYARAVLQQSDDDILVEIGEDGKEIEIDRHPAAVENPVMRALRRQARNGVGTAPGQLPPATFNALRDSAFGKPKDAAKPISGRPLANESVEKLQERLAGLSAVLAQAKEVKAC